MANFFEDNKDLLFHLENTDLDDVINIMEKNFEESKTFDYAPRNLKEARKGYVEILKIAGEIMGNTFAPNA